MNHRDRDRDNDWDRELDDALGSTMPAPDMTRRIMGRLGYMQVSPAVARRRRVRTMSGRLAMCAVAVLGLLLAYHLRDSSDMVRRPSSPTLPAAIGQGVSLQHERFYRALETLERWVPAAPPTKGTPSETAPEDTALGPVC